MHNLLTLSTTYQNQLSQSQLAMNKNMERLSSGKRINEAADDPSKMLRLSRLESQIRGADIANQNIQDGVSFLQMKDEALSSIQGIGQSLRELAIEYDNDALSEEDKDLIRQEAQSLTKEIAEILERTNFNQQSVFSNKDLHIQTGVDRADDYTLSGFENPTIVFNQETIKKEHVKSLYDFSLKDKDGNSLFSGDFSIELRDGEKNHIIRIENEYEVYEGSLQIKDETTGHFEIKINGQEYEGSLKLSDQDNVYELKSNHEVVFTTPDEGWLAEDSFYGDFKKVSEEIHEEYIIHKTPVSFKDIDELNIATVLDVSFIDEKILDPIARERATSGIDQSILEKRLSRNNSQKEIHQQVRSNIEDVDMAQEMMKKIKNEMLVLSNISLIQQVGQNHRKYITQLLQS